MRQALKGIESQSVLFPQAGSSPESVGPPQAHVVAASGSLLRMLEKPSATLQPFRLFLRCSRSNLPGSFFASSHETGPNPLCNVQRSKPHVTPLPSGQEHRKPERTVLNFATVKNFHTELWSPIILPGTVASRGAVRNLSCRL